ncbi:MAG: glycosyltransferase family 4 protein [Muribaculaceae bacterium]|nr:glycosyltransferase family 4 protein [Muribaculaceae bacterium]
MNRLIHIISSKTWGGKERYVLDICRCFRQEGASVSVYTRDAKVIDNEFSAYGIDLRHAPLEGAYDVVSVGILARDLRREPAGTVVHVHRLRDAFLVLMAKMLSRRRDIRVVFTHHTSKAARRQWLAQWVYRRVDAHIFVSDIARRTFFSTIEPSEAKVGEERVSVIHNSIYFDQPSRREEPQSGPVVAMFHGRLSPEKGVEVLIDALESLKGMRTRLWVVGTGDPDYVDALKRRALSRGVYEMIDWKGHVKDVHELIPLCHFGVLPSMWEEGFGLANIEYMSHGRPQVCSNNGAQPEYLDNEVDALMVSAGDAEALGEALVRLAGDKEMRQAMGEHAHQRFSEALSWDRFAKRLREVYRF